MGFRFSKRIRIAKGLNLNLSKSGLGLSFGVRGASISFGKRGVYSNVGIPGTGISWREKIGGGTLSNQESEQPTAPGLSDMIENLALKISVTVDDETGVEEIIIEDKEGHRIEQPAILKKISQLDEYRRMIEQTRSQAFQNAVDRNDKLINIYQSAQPIISQTEVQENFVKLQPGTYEHKPFPEPYPTDEQLLRKLQTIAESAISDWKFWSLGARRMQFVEKHKQAFYSDERAKWQRRKAEFEEAETQRATAENERLQQQYEHEKANFQKIMDCDKQYVEQELEAILSEIRLPVPFHIDFEVEQNTVHLDLDLPEIEDYLSNKPTRARNGQLKFVAKAVSESNEEYARSVVGLAYYFASIAFNVSPAIEMVVIAGYTQRLSKITGHQESEYIYEIQFVRDVFASINVGRIEPIQALRQFPHRIDVSPKFELRTISLIQ